MKEKTVPAKTETQGITETREEERFLRPPVDIYEKDDKLVVVCDMPGVQTNDIEVKIDDGILTIQGKTSHSPIGNKTYSEFALMSFYRQFELPELIDQEKISADLKNGVLTITLPKLEKAKPRQISVKVS